jgi:hypothetical protein
MFSLIIDADEKSRELLSIQTFKKGFQNHHTFSDNSQFSKSGRCSSALSALKM